MPEKVSSSTFLLTPRLFGFLIVGAATMIAITAAFFLLRVRTDASAVANNSYPAALDPLSSSTPTTPPSDVDQVAPPPVLSARSSSKKSTKKSEQLLVAIKEQPSVFSAKQKVSSSDCLLGSEKVPNRKVIFNEVAWMGSTGDGEERPGGAAEKEWIEIKNVSTAAIDLADWQLLNREGTVRKTFERRVLKPSQLFVIDRVTADSDGFSGSLSDAGEWLGLFDQHCRLVDELNARVGFPAGNVSTRQTLERDSQNFGWHTSLLAGGTKGSPNSMPTLASSEVSPSSSGSASTASVASVPVGVAIIPASTVNIPAIRIAQVQINGGTGKSDNDFVKLFNLDDEKADISGWKLRKRSQSGAESSLRVFPENTLILPGEYFIWANSSIAGLIGANVSSSQTLSINNSLALLDASGAVIDALAWGGSLVNPFVEGAVYPDDPDAGQVLARKIADGALVDTDDNAADFELR